MIAHICSDGYIVDTTDSVIGLTVPDANANGYYNGDENEENPGYVVIPVAVNDKTEAGNYSGIKTVEYWIESWNGDQKTETKRETLYDYTDPDTYKGDEATYDDLMHEWTGTIKVSAADNIYDDVRLYVKAADNAGNETMYQTADGKGYLPLKIDSAKPAINISFTEDSPTMTVAGETEADARGYYKNSRTATITITERSSEMEGTKPSDVISITAKDADGEIITVTSEYVSVPDTWTTVTNENPNLDTHTAIVTFNGDANYDLAVSYTDKAGNVSDTPTTGGSTPFHFTVDIGVCETPKPA